MAIGNKLVFDVNGNVEDFVFILSTKDYRHLGAIQNVIPESVHHAGNLASVNEISFEVYKTVEKEVNEEVIEVEEPLWNELTNLKLIYVRELDEYYETNVQLDDTTEVIKKTITCKSLCEAELGQIYIHGLEANTETDIARNDYEPTVFYNKSNPSASLLHRVFSFAPHYTIKHVDESLINLQRTFSVDNTAMYDWLTIDCANEFKCLFMFDSTNRGVYVYDLCTVCKDCGHRAEYIDKCPECGSTNLEYFGDDTTIYVDKENLTDSIQFTTDVDSIKNCFKLVAGDDIITSTVRMLNMNGTDFIYKPTEEQLMEMPLELRNKIVSYDKLYFSYKDEYEKIVSDIYEATNKINYYTHTMMPTIEQSEITAQSEADKLTAINLSPLGLSSVTTSTSQATVESALKNYAKVYVKTGYVKIEINSSNYKYVGTDSSGWNYGTWTGNFKVTNYSDSEDIAYSEIISVKVYDNYQDFIEQKILKNVANNSDEEDSVFDVLSIDELGDFKQALKLYCLNRLTSFYDAIQSALDVLIEVDQASESADLYEPLYMPYYDKLQVCQNEINSRQATINEWQNTYDNLILQQQEIQADLNFHDYLGDELYKIFCMYKREDTYQNDNYISDGLSDAEIIQKAKDFLEVAQKELEKARTPNHSISSTLHNLLIMPEFKPIIDNFKLGNWLRICVDGIVYRLRLIGYELSFSSIQTLSVEFSNITKLNTIANETKNILDSAKSMASNFDYFVAQAKRGNEANVEITHWLEDGLQSALVNIKNNNNEEITFDKHGLWAKTYNSETGNYDPEMFRLTHNILAYTTDGFKTVKAALGKHNYYKFDESGKLVQDIAYGIRCDFVAAGYIYGSQIISGDIYSENYSSTTGSHINLKTGAFTLGSGKIVYNPVTNKMEIKGVNIEWSSSTTPEISDIDGLTEDLAQKSASITANADAITAEVKRATESEGNLSTRVEMNADAISSEVTRANEAEENLSSRITQTADSITSTVNKQITETKEYIDGEIETTNTALSSKIEQTATNITSTVAEIYETKEGAKKSYETLQSSITQNANNIELKVSTDSIISTINQSAEEVSIKANKISLEGIVTANNYFKILSDGSMVATNGTFTGIINANQGGTIGGWTIAPSQLIKEDAKNGFMVRFHCPSELGTCGNGNADVLVVRIGTESSSYKYPLVLSSNGSITLNGESSSQSTYTKLDNGYISLVGSFNGTLGNCLFSTPLEISDTSGNHRASLSAISHTISTNEKYKAELWYNYLRISYDTNTQYSTIGTNSIYTTGTIKCDGTKSRIATTENYDKRLLYCYETPTPTFGDIGEGAIDETGKCYVFLDDIFAETIDTDCSYQVFLQSYGKGECYVTERTSSYFIVEGTANLSFGWEIKSVQLGYDTMRLEEFSEENIIYKENSIAEETYGYLESLLFTVDEQEYPNESEEIE